MHTVDYPQSQATILALIRMAVLAPSSRNAQPWKFTIQGNTVCIFPDSSRSLPVVDPDKHALYISLGAALENLVIAAQAAGFEVQVDVFPDGEPQECVRVCLQPGNGSVHSALSAAIPERQSTRSLYDRSQVPPGDLEHLMSTRLEHSVSTLLFTERLEMEPLVEYAQEATRIQYSDKAFIKELLSWFRFNRDEIARRQDGLTGLAMGLPGISLPTWLGRLAFRIALNAEKEADRMAKLMRSSSGLVLFMTERDDRRSWIALGRSFERWALSATILGIQHAHVNMPCEVYEVRAQLRNYLRFSTSQPLMMLRIGYGRPMPRSPRRPVTEVLVNGSEIKT